VAADHAHCLSNLAEPRAPPLAGRGFLFCDRAGHPMQPMASSIIEGQIQPSMQSHGKQKRPVASPCDNGAVGRLCFACRGLAHGHVFCAALVVSADQRLLPQSARIAAILRVQDRFCPTSSPDHRGQAPEPRSGHRPGLFRVRKSIKLQRSRQCFVRLPAYGLRSVAPLLSRHGRVEGTAREPWLLAAGALSFLGRDYPLDYRPWQQKTR
jgi:hypothetical protein